MSESWRRTFIERCLAGEADLEDIDDAVDSWHESDGTEPISAFLGMTADEYAVWVERPSSLGYIIYARRHHVPLARALYLQSKERLAARSGSADEARALLEWLRKTGRLEA